MLGDLFTGWHLIIVLAVVVLLFGATKLPALAKGVGSSIRIFRGEMKSMSDDDAKSDNGAAEAAAAPAVAATSLQPTPSDPQPKP